MTRSAHILALAVAAACFLLGRGKAPNRAPTEDARPAATAEARAASEPRASFQDELAARRKLTESEAIRALEEWIQRKDALVDQFALYDAAARADADGLSAMLAQLDRHPEPIASEARHVIRLRMAAQAESAAGPRDLATLTAAIERGEHETDWRRMRDDISALCDVEAKGVWQAIQRISDDFKRGEARQIVLRALAEQDPVAGATAARTLLRDEPFPRSRNLAQEAFAIALERDPAAIIRWYRSQPDAQSASAFVTEMLETRAPPSVAAMELIELLPDSSRKSQLIFSMARAHAESDLAQTLYWIDRSLPRAEALAAKAEIAGEIMRQDRRAALDLVEELPDANLRAQAIARIAGSWASFDLDAALAWALDLRDERARSQAVAALARIWASKDFAAAARYVADARDPNAKRVLIAQLAQERARDASPEELVEATGEVVDRDLGAALADHAISALAPADPRGAWIALRSLGGEEDVGYGSQVSRIARFWSILGPPRANCSRRAASRRARAFTSSSPRTPKWRQRKPSTSWRSCRKATNTRGIPRCKRSRTTRRSLRTTPRSRPTPSGFWSSVRTARQ